MSSRKVKELSIRFQNDDDLESVINAIEYDGLNLDKVREEFASSTKDDDEVVDDVITCLISYMMAGNNVEKLTRKVIDQNVGLLIKKRLRDIGVKSVASGNNDITLPRTAIAFLPAYYLLRFFQEDKLQGQTSSVIPTRYKDLSFAGVERVYKMDGYKDFHLAFNELITIKRGIKEVASNDSKIDSKLSIRDIKATTESDAEKWVQIAQQGFKADIKIHSLMTEALNYEKEDVSLKSIKDMICKIFRTVISDFGTEVAEMQDANNEVEDTVNEKEKEPEEGEIGEDKLADNDGEMIIDPEAAVEEEKDDMLVDIEMSEQERLGKKGKRTEKEAISDQSKSTKRTRKERAIEG